MKNNQSKTSCKRGFTLIELLVVVLIIGILAAVAVPQYQKAVLKSRFTQWTTYMSSMDKAIDIWVLANGYPTTNTFFTGENPDASLDIDWPCTSVLETECYTDLGRFVAGCSDGNCWIDFETNYEGYKGPFPTGRVWTSKYHDDRYGNDFGGQRLLNDVPADKTFRKMVCEWWATHYGKERMNERSTTSCAEVGV